MRIKDLKEIIQTLPEEAVVLLLSEDIYDVESVTIEKHDDGRMHLILNAEV